MDREIVGAARDERVHVQTVIVSFHDSPVFYISHTGPELVQHSGHSHAIPLGSEDVHLYWNETPCQPRNLQPPNLQTGYQPPDAHRKHAKTLANAIKPQAQMLRNAPHAQRSTHE
ncbi:hypothetical protein M758_9G041700 [Ceratodon purpureus]|nr:hypothetical protein M758_9G041700 [Ceratodon purpureus]